MKALNANCCSGQIEAAFHPAPVRFTKPRVYPATRFAGWKRVPSPPCYRSAKRAAPFRDEFRHGVSVNKCCAAHPVQPTHVKKRIDPATPQQATGARSHFNRNKMVAASQPQVPEAMNRDTRSRREVKAEIRQHGPWSKARDAGRNR
jgi:hypothetical protein